MKPNGSRTFTAILIVAGGFAVLTSAPATAETITGSATVIDGDTLEISGRRIRLFGIDAPEFQQVCARSGEQWQCGTASSDRLRQLVATGAVSCSGAERDQYLRLLAVCMAGHVELNRTMVAEGWATAFRRYSTDYVGEEDSARSARLGLWNSEFESPEDFRRAEDEAGLRATPRQRPRANQPETSCVIKGNRSQRGDWIYHLPGMPYYEQTVAEEMFCTEAQAVAAGYRRSRAR